jgi:hypothetical protein
LQRNCKEKGQAGSRTTNHVNAIGQAHRIVGAKVGMAFS